MAGPIPPPTDPDTRVLADAVETLLNSTEWQSRLSEARESRRRILAVRRSKAEPLLLRHEWAAPPVNATVARRRPLPGLAAATLVLAAIWPEATAMDAPTAVRAPAVAAQVATPPPPTVLASLREASGTARLRIHLLQDAATEPLQNAEFVMSNLGVRRNVVRFYDPADAAVAMNAAQAIGAKVEDMTGYSRKLPAGTLEVWLGQGS